MTARKKQRATVRADGFANEAAAAEFLGRSPACLRAWRAAEKGPPYIQIDARGPVLYHLPQLEDWLWQHKHVPGEDPPRVRQQSEPRDDSLRDHASNVPTSSHARAPTPATKVPVACAHVPRLDLE